MSPIENLWAIVKRGMRNKRPTTKDGLIATLNDVWHNDKEVAVTCKKKILGMPDRVRDLVAVKGDPQSINSFVF